MKKFTSLCAVLAALSVPASAKKWDKWMDHKDKVPHVDVSIAAGESRASEIVTSGKVSIQGKQVGDVAVFGNALTSDGEIIGNVATFGGPATLGGKVTGDVSAMGGSVSINGKVIGEVAVTGGDLTLGPDAVITGDVALLGGKLTKADGSKIKGSVSDVNLGALTKMPAQIANALKYANLGGAQDREESRRESKPEDEEEGLGKRLALFAGFVASLLCVGLLVALVALIAPKPVDAVAQSVKTDFWGSAGIGVLMLLAFVPAIVAMAVSILGIPLIPLFVVACAGALVLGLSASSRIAGERLFESLQKPQPGNAAVAAIVGYALLLSLMFLGKVLRLAGGILGFAGGMLLLAGLMVVCGALMVGLGGVWRTRMGTRP